MTKKPRHNGERNDDEVEYKLKHFIKNLKRRTLCRLVCVNLASLAVFLLVTVIRTALNTAVDLIPSVPFKWNGLIAIVVLLAVLYVIRLLIFRMARLYDKLRKDLDKKIVNIYFYITISYAASLWGIDLFPSILNLASKWFLV